MMPQWTRKDTLLRHTKETAARVERAKHGWRQLAEAIISKLLW